MFIEFLLLLIIGIGFVGVVVYLREILLEIRAIRERKY